MYCKTGVGRLGLVLKAFTPKASPSCCRQVRELRDCTKQLWCNSSFSPPPTPPSPCPLTCGPLPSAPRSDAAGVPETHGTGRSKPPRAGSLEHRRLARRRRRRAPRTPPCQVRSGRDAHFRESRRRAQVSRSQCRARPAPAAPRPRGTARSWRSGHRRRGPSLSSPESPLTIPRRAGHRGAETAPGWTHRHQRRQEERLAELRKQHNGNGKRT